MAAHRLLLLLLLLLHMTSTVSTLQEISMPHGDAQSGAQQASHMCSKTPDLNLTRPYLRVCSTSQGLHRPLAPCCLP